MHQTHMTFNKRPLCFKLHKNLDKKTQKELIAALDFFLFFRLKSGLQITAGQRTMSGQK